MQKKLHYSKDAKFLIAGLQVRYLFSFMVLIFNVSQRFAAGGEFLGAKEGFSEAVTNHFLT